MKKTEKRYKRNRRVAIKSRKTNLGYMLSVFRSNRYIYGQIFDLNKLITVAGYSDKQLKDTDLKKKEEGKVNKSFLAGEQLAKIALKKKITQVVFNRGGYKYHGRVKAFAQGARKGGLEF